MRGIFKINPLLGLSNALFMVVVLGVCSTSSAQDYSSWEFQKQLVLNTTVTGASITEADVVDFPLLIRLNQNNFTFSEANASGSDIRFTEPEGSDLPFEIERWDDSLKLAEIWVLLDTIFKDNNTQYINMFWGNDTASNKSNGKNVFTVSSGFAGVWHLNNDPKDDVANSVKDATQNAFHGTPAGNMTSDDLVAGNIGMALDFDGNLTSNEADVIVTADIDKVNDMITFSAWIYTSEASQPGSENTGYIIQKDQYVGTSPYGIMLNNNNYGFGTIRGASNTKAVPLNDSSWHLLTGRGDGLTFELWVDGVVTPSKIPDIWDDNDELMGIGSSSLGANYRPFKGKIDEVQVSTVARSRAWIRLAYESQKQSSKLVASLEGPILGVVNENIIPVENVQQLPDGKGTVTINFRVKNQLAGEVQLNNIQYIVDSVWVDIPEDSPALIAGWNTTDYSSQADFTGTLHSIKIETGLIPGLTGKSYDAIQFGLQAKKGVLGPKAITEPIPLDNEFPEVTISTQVTPDQSPRITGTSNEQLLLVELTINGKTYPGELIDSANFRVEQGTLTPLSNGTYDVLVTAADLLGNSITKNIAGALIVDSKAPSISVNALITNNISPEINGTINNNSAKVKITIGDETFPAQVGEGLWRIAEGTFQQLHEGTFDVFAEAMVGNITGVDGTSNELVIDLTSPKVTLESTVTNDNNPSLNGTMSESLDSLTIQLNNQRVKGEFSNLTWSVAPGPFSGIADGAYPLILDAVDRAGNRTIDSSSVFLVDKTVPQLSSIHPNQITTTLLPDLKMEFSESVKAGEGNIHIYKSQDNSLHQSIAASSGSGIGTNTLTYGVVDSLSELTDYYITVDKEAITDLADNPYFGILTTDFWSFRTASKNATFIDNITSTNPAGIYPQGSVINITIWFQDSVTLTGGNLNVTMETGFVDSVVVIEPFSLRDSISFTYTVGVGDYAPVLNVNSLKLDPGASLVNAEGSEVVLDIGQGQNLASSVIIALDGIPLVFTVLNPQNEQRVDNAAFSFTLSKNIASGSVNWRQSNEAGNIDPDDLINLTIPFDTSMYLAGTYNQVNLNPNLSDGGVYTLTFTVADSAGNTVVVKVTDVQIGDPISELRITPALTQYKLNDEIQFQALDAQSGVPVTGGVIWSLIGEGSIAAEGFFKSTHIGKLTIIATLKNTFAQIQLRVFEGSISVAPNSIELIEAADNLHIKPGVPLTTNTSIGFSFIDTTLLSDFELVGPNIAFDSIEVTDLTISLRVDTLRLNTLAEPGYGVYELMDNENNIWRWVPVTKEGDWSHFQITNNNLGRYILAQIKLKPEIKIFPHSDPVVGKDLQITHLVQSIIENPEIDLIYQEGGGAQTTITPDNLPGDSLVVNIVGSSVSLNGMIYQIEVRDGSRNTSSAWQEVNVTNSGDVKYSTLLQKDVYQSFSLPLNHSSLLVEDLLLNEWGAEDRSVWRLYKYEDDFVELTKKNGMILGKAYWFKMRGKVPLITFPLGTAESVPLMRGISVPLRAGWNMISNPYYFPLSLQHLQNVNGGKKLIVYGFPEEGVYYPLEPDSTLDPWKGYIIWNGVEGLTNLNSLKIIGLDTGATGPQKEKLVFTQAPRMSLSLRGEKNQTGMLSLLWNVSGAKVGYDEGDLPKPNSFSKKVNLSLKVPWSKQGYLEDRRPNLGEGQSWSFVTQATKKNEGMTLSLSGGQQLGESYRAILLDEVRGNFIKLKSESIQAYSFKAHDINEEGFEIAIGTDNYIKQKIQKFESVVRQNNLGTNYPNPFTSYTTFQYQISTNNSGAATQVQLAVYNLQGQKVKILVHRNQHQGRYQIEWNGKNDEGKALPPGTYFYRLKVGAEFMQKKLVIFK